MLINPATGKPWINNYTQMMGVLFANQNHKYIELHRYFEIIGKIEGKAKAGYAMILHSHLAHVICNRTPGVHSNIFMYVDNQKGVINNSNEMAEWMNTEGYMNCNGAHLLKIASKEIWFLVYKSLLDVGLISLRAGSLRVMFPIQGRFLPIPYAHVAFLSRLKKDNSLSENILKTLRNKPKELRTNLEELPKEDLISELIKLKTEHLIPSKKSEVFKMLFEEVRNVTPHEWGNSSGNKQENLLKKISEKYLENNLEKKVENFSENNSENNPENKVKNNSEKFPKKISEKFSLNIIEKINQNPTWWNDQLEKLSNDFSAKNISDKIPEKILEDNLKNLSQKEMKKSLVKTLLPEDIHNYEKPKKKFSDDLPGKLNDAAENQKVNPKNTPDPTPEELIFYADDTTGKDLERFEESREESKDDAGISEEEFDSLFDDTNDTNDTEDTDEFSEVQEIPAAEFDIFGLPKDVGSGMGSDLPELPGIVQTDVTPEDFYE